MGILLTPEELVILQEYVEPSNESIGYERNIAKAQLKKVVEELSRYKVPSATPYGDIITIFTEGDVWQSLIKEVE